MPRFSTTVKSENWSAQAFVEERTRQGVLQAEVSFKEPTVFAKLTKYHGDKTQWVLDAWIKVWLSEAFADWRLAGGLVQKEIIPQCGHIPHREKPEVILNLVHEFLK